MEEATESKEGTFLTEVIFIAKITFLLRGLNFKMANVPPGPPLSATYDHELPP